MDQCAQLPEGPSGIFCVLHKSLREVPLLQEQRSRYELSNKFFSFSSLIAIRIALASQHNSTTPNNTHKSINNQLSMYIYMPSCLLNSTETLSDPPTSHH